jgi:hypothetical protein
MYRADTPAIAYKARAIMVRFYAGFPIGVNSPSRKYALSLRHGHEQKRMLTIWGFHASYREENTSAKPLIITTRSDFVDQWLGCDKDSAAATKRRALNSSSRISLMHAMAKGRSRRALTVCLSGQ